MCDRLSTKKDLPFPAVLQIDIDMRKPKLSKCVSPLMQRLEDRIMFDAAPDAILLLPESLADQTALTTPAQVAQAEVSQLKGPRELIIVDGSVQDTNALIEQIANQSSGSSFEIRLMETDRSGVEQISEILAEVEKGEDYSALHVISHGTDGAVQLGSSWLTSHNLSSYAGQIGLWGDSLTADADILFYGCNLAASDAGLDFIESMGHLTGADIAASDDITGHDDLGGNWVLEAETGSIETQAIAAENWEGQLATVSYGDLFQNIVSQNSSKLIGLLVNTRDSGVDIRTTLVSTQSDYRINRPAIFDNDFETTDNEFLLTFEFFRTGTTNPTQVNATFSFDDINYSNSGSLKWNDSFQITSSAPTSVSTFGGASWDSANLVANAVEGPYGTVNITYSGNNSISLFSIRMGVDGTGAFASRDGLIDPGRHTVLLTFTAPAPILDLDGDDSSGATGGDYQANSTGAFTPIVDSDFSLTDTGGSNMANLTMDVAGVVDGANEILTLGGADIPLDADASITVSAGGTTFRVAYSVGTNGAGTGTFTITNDSGGDMPIADITTLLTNSSYRNDLTNLTVGDRTFDFTVNNGTLDSNTAQSTISVIASNTAPTLDLDLDAASTGFTTTFSEGTAPVSIADIDISVLDLDDTHLDSAVVTLTNPQTDDRFRVNGAEVAANDTGTIAGTSITFGVSPDGYTISLSGADTKANYETAIRAIEFENTSQNPNTADRLIDVTVNDGDANSNTATALIQVVPVNDIPILDLDANGDSFTPNDGGNLFQQVNMVAIGSGNYAGTLENGDTFTVSSTGTLTVNSLAAPTDPTFLAQYGSYTDSAYTGAGETVTITFDSGIAPQGTYVILRDVNLNEIANLSSSNGVPQLADRVSTFVGSNDVFPIWDPATGSVTANPAGASNGQVLVFDVSGLADLDIEYATSSNFRFAVFTTNSDFETTFLEGGSPVSIADTDTRVVDPDSTNLQSGSVTLTNPQTDDRLLVAGLAVVGNETGTIAGTSISYIVSADGFTISLVGNDTLANYETAIKAIAFENTSTAPSLTDRFVNVTVNDGSANSNTANSIIHVVSVDSQPSMIDTNDGSSVAGADAEVLESDLPTGSNAAGSGETATGMFTLRSPDGFGSLIVAGRSFTLSDLNNLGSAPVTVNGNHGELTLTGFTTATGEMTYSYTLMSEVDHSGGQVIDNFSMVLTDSDGDNQNGTLGILVVDDVVVALDDTNMITEDSSVPATGNVTSNDISGADVTATPITAVVAGTGSPSGAGNVGSGLVGNYGTLTLNNDGSYSYTLDSTNPAVQSLGSGTSITEVYTYETTDADGDTAEATLTITIHGTDDSITIGGTNDGSTAAGADAQVFESDLSTGSNAAGTGETATGEFTLTAGDGINTLQVGNTTLTLAQLNALGTTPVTITGAEGDLTLYGFNATNGEVNYRYTLTSNADHSGGQVIDGFALTLTDSDGDTHAGTLGILILDDTPTGNDDITLTDEDSTLTPRGSVLANDFLGADTDFTSFYFVTGVATGTSTPLPANVGTPVSGAYGDLLLDNFGSYRYFVDNTHPAVNALNAGQTLDDVFTYEFVDSDGSPSTATLTIIIHGINDAPVAEDNTATVTEDGPLTDSGNVIVDDDGRDHDSNSAFVDQDPERTPLIVTDVDGTNVSGTTNIAGSYGTLTINPDGTYTYTLDNNNTDVQALGKIDSLVETFTYTISDQQSLVANNGFENYDPSIDLTNFNSALPLGWKAVQGTPDIFDESVSALGLTYDPSPSGGVFLHALANERDFTREGFEQTLQGLIPGEQYTINFSQSASSSSFETGQQGQWLVTTGSTTFSSSVMTAPATGTALGWTNQSFTFTATGPTQTLTFMANSVAPGIGGFHRVDLAIDGITITQVGAKDTAQLIVTINGSDDAIVISGTDDSSMVSGADAEVLESNLATGSNPSGTGETVTGAFTISAGDGVDTLQVGGEVITLAQLNNLAVTNVLVSGIHGNLTLNSYDAGTGEVTYRYSLTRNADHSGGNVIDSFAVTLTDEDGDIQTGTLGVLIVDDAPFAADDVDSVTEDSGRAATGNVVTAVDSIGGDSNTTDGVADGTGADGLATLPVTGVVAGTASPVAGNVGTPILGTFGALTLNGDGTYSYFADDNNVTVNALQAGDTPLSEVFTYELTDTDGGVSTATLTIAIHGSNDPPIAVDDEVSGDGSKEITGSLLDNDSDPDGDPLTVSTTPVTPPAHGKVVIDPDGNFTYTPEPGFTGTDSFQYQVCDNSGECSEATVTISVQAFFGYDSLTNESLSDPFGNSNVYDHREILFSHQLQQMAAEPVLAGYATPGSILVGKIYGSNGALIGETSTTASAAGNWMMNFFGVESESGGYVVIEHIGTEEVEMANPHHFRLTADTYRSFQLGQTHVKKTNIGSIMAELPSASLEMMHNQNTNPLSLLD